ncbi:LytTR family transcriptional regulator [Flavobacterium zepuense]|uniref:LytTR family transcriptional regulator n=1 Tax=Flavobacterium zepuense TaxID=2593302 RepID=A0A552UUP1_9FLAO|nr:LytTR family DNA-binding domain-containing protein [Flavobacterium zepuense]TRW21946.1 LytTR family transcriptional regulator [Flavobacterium zepuense]
MEIKYNDGYFRLVLAAIAAHIIVMYNVEKGFFEALFTLSYIRGFIGSWVIALLLIQYVHFVTLRLDKKYDWHDNTLLRFLWQTLLAFAAPAFLAFLLAAMFFWIFDRNIFHTSYLSQDYTLVIFMILVINIYYFGLHSFLLHRQVTRNVNRATESPSREILIVDTPTRSIPVKLDTVAYFFILGGTVFMRTFDMPSLGQSYQIGIPLKNLEDILDKRLFFRINRRMIVNFNACTSYKQGRNKTLELIVAPVLYETGTKIPAEHERLTHVSEDRVVSFKLWMDR